MEKIEVLKVPFYKFKVHDSIRDDVLKAVESLEFVPETMKTNGFVYRDFFHEGLFDFFENSIKEVQKIYFNDNLEFPIVDCWVNKFQVMNNLTKHAHSNSVISGVYYVTSHNAANTVFEMRDPWTASTHSSQVPLMNINKFENPIWGETKADAGTLVLFPPSLFHYMKPISDRNTTRYTIAFNSFPSGVICDYYTRMLTVNALSLRERLAQSKT